MLMDAIIDQFWPTHGHNLRTAGVPLQLRPGVAREILQLKLGIYMGIAFVIVMALRELRTREATLPS